MLCSCHYFLYEPHREHHIFYCASVWHVQFNIFHCVCMSERMKQCLLNFNVRHKSGRIEHYIFIAASKFVIMCVCCRHSALFCHLEQNWTTLVAMVKQIDYTNEETIICLLFHIMYIIYTLGIFEIFPLCKVLPSSGTTL